MDLNLKLQLYPAGRSKYSHMVLEARVLQIPPTTGKSSFLGDHMSNDVSRPFNLHCSLPTTCFSLV